MLHIIPVIDLLDGTVVHAKKGQRASYQPIMSSLTASHYPLDIVKAFMDTYPFKTLYIADLNRIQKPDITHNLNDKVIKEIINTYPTLNLWIDAGITAIKQAQIWKTTHTRPILASESFTNIQTYNDVKAHINSQCILSLDFLPDGYHGPQTLQDDIKYWPSDVIVMSLKKVGSNSGADIKKLQAIITKAQQHNIYAAGGIRHMNDLQLLSNIGVNGALVATALHNKTLTTSILTQVS